jgi:group I intron endonuclease
VNSGVYRITNPFNGKVYIGSAVDFDLRWKRHYNPALTADFKKFGKENFVFEKLCYCCPNKLMMSVVEQRFLDLYFDNGVSCYNIQPTAYSNIGHRVTEEQLAHMRGNQNHLGHKHSADTRAKMAAAKRGRPQTQEHRNKRGEARLGHVVTQETRDKISAGRMGIGPSAEVRVRLSEANKGKPWSEARRLAHVKRLQNEQNTLINKAS